MSSAEIFNRFVRAINDHDVSAITALMTADHLFINSLGQPVRGAAAMQAGWKGYFAMCPDYWLRTDTVLAQEEIVLATGEAGGIINGVAWSTPAAWKATIRDGAISEWRVFADNKPVYDILAKSSSTS